MNSVLKQFLLIGNEVLKQAVPGVAMAEVAVVGIKKGADRRKSVIDLIKAGLVVGEGITEKDLLDNTKFNSGVEKVNDGLTDIMNGIKDVRASKGLPE